MLCEQLQAVTRLLCSMLCQAGEQLAHCEGNNDGDSNLQQQGARQAILAKMREDLNVG